MKKQRILYSKKIQNYNRHKVLNEALNGEIVHTQIAFNNSGLNSPISCQDPNIEEINLRRCNTIEFSLMGYKSKIMLHV